LHTGRELCLFKTGQPPAMGVSLQATSVIEYFPYKQQTPLPRILKDLNWVKYPGWIDKFA
jgi:hypothetical protein